MQHVFQDRVSALKERLQGRWSDALIACGVDPMVVNGRNQPCPACGGDDRFQFTDWERSGSFYCRSCGAGDGIALLKMTTGLSFVRAVKTLEDWAGMAGSPTYSPRGERLELNGRGRVQRIWTEGRPVTRGDPVDRYLRGRGLELHSYPRSLRCHPDLGYYVREPGKENARLVGSFPSMLAAVTNLSGNIVNIHRTYVLDGKKAPVHEAKKLLVGGLGGECIQLSPAGEDLALSEGIESALAVFLRTGYPVWSAISCFNLERVVVPAGVKRLRIYGDNDADGAFDGQASAYALARKVAKRRENGIEAVSVFIPNAPGDDWHDVWVRAQQGKRHAA